MYTLFRSMRYFIPFLVFALLVGFFYVGLGKDPTQVPSALINKPMPSFELSSVQDRTLKLNRELFMEQISVLHVWASWCHTCQREHSLWLDIAKNYKNIGIYALVFKDGYISTNAWLHQNGNPYHFCIDDQAGNLAMDLGVSGTPVTFLVDQHGLIRFRHTGPLNQSIWQREFVPRIKKLERTS